MNHLREAKWMSQRGHSVIVFAVKNTPFFNSCKNEGLDTQIISKQKKYYDFSKARSLAKKLNSLGVTHFVIRSTYDMSIAATIKHRLKSKITTVYCQEMQLGVKKSNLLHSIRFNYIDVWRAPLNSLADQVRAWTNFKNKLIVIPSALDLDSFKIDESKSECRSMLDIPENALLLGLIGRFDPQKGQLLLLEAMSKTKNNDYHVVFLGEPTKNEGSNYSQLMHDTINKYNLESRVHIRPFIDKPSVFYHAVDWLVMATKAETFGMVTIESVACGTPVIGSNAGGTPELLENESAGILFETMDADSLATSIDRVINEKLSFYTEELKQKALVYDHNVVCEALEKAIELA